jgi:hypothetical protein
MDKNIAEVHKEAWDELIRLTNRIIDRLWQIHDDLVESDNDQSEELPIESVLETESDFRIEPSADYYRINPLWIGIRRVN